MVFGVDMPYPHYRCPVCGKELPLTEARMTVTCAEHEPAEPPAAFTVREVTSADKSGIEEICDRAWGETLVDSFGKTFDVLTAENIVAEAGGELAGLVSLAADGGELTMVLLSVYPQYQGSGIGSALIEAAVASAVKRNLPSVKVAVGNDDISSLYFYQRHGFVIFDVAIGVLADKLGSASPGFAGIPTRDEVRLRRPAC